MMSDMIAQIACAAAELEAELQTLLRLNHETSVFAGDDTETLPHLFVERFPHLSDERAELKGLLKIGRAASRSEKLSPAVAAASLAMMADFRTLVARLAGQAARA